MYTALPYNTSKTALEEYKKGKITKEKKVIIFHFMICTLYCMESRVEHK